MIEDINQDELLAEVQQAYEKQEIKAYFQPKYDALTGTMIGAEALARWIKEDGTFVMPDSYIPYLEQSEAICEFDWYMLRRVCQTLKEQQEKEIPAVKISVNFSRNHIFNTNYVEELCRVVDSYSILHHMIEIEITESALGHNTEQVDAFVRAIRKEGFTVAIDDFGSGLSSLSMVKDVAMDTLKIDRSLLSRNCEDEKERIVLESIVSFAHRLKLVTVAEGVETQEQLGFLRTCGCDVIQGYLFARPMPKEEYWERCKTDIGKEIEEDILSIQPQSSATQLLLDAIYTRYPLIIYINLTRNSFYMMAYANYTATSCLSSGAFDESIIHASSTLHPDDQEKFRETFSIPNQMAAYERGEKSISLVTRQLGDDGVYRKVETTNYFVKNPSVDDVLVISLNHNL